MINYFLPLIFFTTVLIDAAVNAYLIKVKNRKINHKVEGLIYLLVCLIISVPLLKFFHVNVFWLASFAIITRLTFFDPILNIFRGLNINYEGDPNKPVEEQSIYDRIELSTGISIEVFRVLYLCLYILNLIIFLL